MQIPCHVLADLPHRFVFSNGSIIAAGGYAVVECNPDKPASATNTGFGLKASGAALYLRSSCGEANTKRACQPTIARQPIARNAALPLRPRRSQAGSSTESHRGPRRTGTASFSTISSLRTR